jgi:dienelactone hydrolase
MSLVVLTRRVRMLTRPRRMWFSLLATAGIALLLGAISEPAHAAVQPTEVHFRNGQDIVLDGRLYRPQGTRRRPAVVMMHGCSGMFSNSDPAAGVQSLYTEWAERLVAAGYVALLVDSFTPRAAEQNQCGNGDAGVSEVSDRPFDAAAAHSFLKSKSWINAQRIGLLGWSHGASSTLATIEQGVTPLRPFRAAVAFYPGCGLFGAFGGISGSTWAPITPVRILHGDIDPLYTSGYCNTRVQHAKLLTGVPIVMTAFAGAQHSFDSADAVGGKWTVADVAAKTRADAAAMRWFARRLLPQPAP